MKNSQNKWWDGYTQKKKSGELMPVLIDELDKHSAKWCMTFLKKWADKVPC